jgi:predicted dehydrogenase
MKKKICVVGSGNWGLNHVRTLSSLGSLGGIVETDLVRLNELRIEFPKCDFHSSLDSALKKDFDAFIIATPAPTHYDLAYKVISNQRSLLVEKPLTLDYKSSIELCKLAEKMGVQFMVGHVLLFHPAFQKMKKMISQGKLGNIQYIYSNRLNLGTFRTNENVFWSFAPHDIALFNFFFEENPISITSRGIDILQKNIHDSSITSFKYDHNKMGHIFVSWLHPFKEHRFVIIGSNGMLHFEDSNDSKPLLFYDKKAEFIDKVPSPKSGEIKRIHYVNEPPLTNELKYFISKLDGGKLEIANGWSGAEVIKTLELATESLNKNE